MATNKTRQAQILPAPGFYETLADFQRRFPAISTTFGAFLTAKIQRPPAMLSRGMRDHTLGGVLAGFRECHLAHDACLIYTDKNDVVTLVTILDHDDMSGAKARAAARKFAPYRS